MRRKRGGSLFHPYLASDSPNFIQTLEHKWNGALDPVPKPASPVDYTWEWKAGQSFRMGPTPSIPLSTGPSVRPPTMSPTTRGGYRKTYRKRRVKSRRVKSRRK